MGFFFTSFGYNIFNIMKHLNIVLALQDLFRLMLIVRLCSSSFQPDESSLTMGAAIFEHLGHGCHHCTYTPGDVKFRDCMT